MITFFCSFSLANTLANNDVNVLLPTPPLPDKTNILYFTEDNRCFNTSKAINQKINKIYLLNNVQNNRKKIENIFTCLDQDAGSLQMRKLFDLDIPGMQILDLQKSYRFLGNLIFLLNKMIRLKLIKSFINQ